MKILVGIMYCIENEFEQCKQAIRNQTHRDWEVFTVENLPNKEAHETLYQTFMDRADEFDLFIKVDADMVLSRDTFFEEVIQQMKTGFEKNHFIIGVWDHFTNRLIYALHVYRSSVKWVRNDEQYFVDMVNEPTNKKYFLKVNGPLAPAADHCPNPSPFQSFHFGLHKAVKVMQNGVKKKKAVLAKGHAHNIKLMFLLYLKGRKNEVFHFSLLGAIWALKENITSTEVDYKNRRAHLAFEKYQNLSKQEKETIINNFISTQWPPIKSVYFVDFFVNQQCLKLRKVPAAINAIITLNKARYVKYKKLILKIS